MKGTSDPYEISFGPTSLHAWKVPAWRSQAKIWTPIACNSHNYLLPVDRAWCTQKHISVVPTSS